MPAVLADAGHGRGVLRHKDQAGQGGDARPLPCPNLPRQQRWPGETRIKINRKYIYGIIIIIYNIR